MSTIPVVAVLGIFAVVVVVVTALVLRYMRNRGPVLRTLADPPTAGETGMHRGEIGAPAPGPYDGSVRGRGGRVSGPEGTRSWEFWESVSYAAVAPATPAAAPATGGRGDVFNFNLAGGGASQAEAVGMAMSLAEALRRPAGTATTPSEEEVADEGA